jgi:hypothetical protein
VGIRLLLQKCRSRISCLCRFLLQCIFQHFKVGIQVEFMPKVSPECFIGVIYLPSALLHTKNGLQDHLQP